MCTLSKATLSSLLFLPSIEGNFAFSSFRWLACFEGPFLFALSTSPLSLVGFVSVQVRQKLKPAGQIIPISAIELGLSSFLLMPFDCVSMPSLVHQQAVILESSMWP